MSTVVTLNVPASGTGTPSDVSAFGGNKTIVADGTMLPGEMLVIEASEDPTGTLEANRTYNGVLTIDSNFPGKITLDVVANTMRVVRYFPQGTSPSITLTGASGIQNFSALNVPTITAPAGGVADGTPLDVSAFGALLSVAIGGSFLPNENVLIMGSLDNVIYDGIFSVNTGYPGLRTFAANYNWLKVRRSGPPNPATLTAVVGGSSEGGAGPIPGTGVLQFDSIALVGTKLNAFVTSGYPKGTLAYVGNDTFVGQNSVQDYFTLCYGEALTPDGLTIVNSPTFATDGAQWKRLNTVNQRWLAEGEWKISNAGNDENTGTTDAFPLKSMQEANRRQRGQNIGPNRTVRWTQLDDMDEVQFAVMSNVRCEPTGRAVWVGATTQVAFGSTAITWTTRNATDEYRVDALNISAVPLGTILHNDTRDTISLVNGYLGGEVPPDAVTVNQPRSVDPVTGSVGSPDEWVTGNLVSGITPYKIPGFPWASTGKGYVLSLLNVLPQALNQQNAMLPSEANIIACNIGNGGAGMDWVGGDNITWGMVGFFTSNTLHGKHTMAGCSAINSVFSFVDSASMNIVDYFSLHGSAIMTVDQSIVRMETFHGVFGVFDVGDGARAIDCFFAGQYLAPSEIMYGSNNVNAVWVSAGEGCQCAVGSIVGTTTAVLPLSVAGVGYLLAAIPIVDLPNFAGIR